MSKPIRKISKKAGLPPGTLVHVGKRRTDKVKVSVIDYNASEFSETICSQPFECFPFKETDTVSWINVDGLHDIDTIAAIGEHFGLHPLVQEDILNTRHRPKMEEYDGYVFVTLKMLGISKNRQSVITEQVSVVLGSTWVISFQEQQGDIFDAIRQRLRDKVGNIRDRGADYLLYRLIDTTVDNYFFVTEYFGETIEILEEKVLKSINNDHLQQIQHLKKQLIAFRKSVTPLREAVSALHKDAGELISDTTSHYLRDVYEHVINASDAIESQRDMLSSLMDLYHTSVSNKMNQVMQVLTIIATIFIPLTFLAGIYGMNFDTSSPYNMPELQWKYGYMAFWALIILIFIGLLFYFRKRKWL